MTYELYTFPNCEHCREIKEIFKDGQITYEEINIGSSQGKKVFQGLYKENRDSVKRDHAGIILPVLVESDDSGIIKIIQGEEIKQLF